MGPTFLATRRVVLGHSERGERQTAFAPQTQRGGVEISRRGRGNCAARCAAARWQTRGALLRRGNPRFCLRQLLLEEGIFHFKAHIFGAEPLNLALRDQVPDFHRSGLERNHRASSVDPKPV